MSNVKCPMIIMLSGMITMFGSSWQLLQIKKLFFINFGKNKLL